MVSVRKDLLAGERVKSLRQSRHLTQDQLAKAAGVSRSLVAQWETGRSGFAAKLAQIARVLEVPVRMLQPGGTSDDEAIEQSYPGSDTEAFLLQSFRRMDPNDQLCVLHLVRRLGRT